MVAYDCGTRVHGMGADEGALEEDLDRVPHHAHLHLPSAIGVPHPLAGAGEAHDAGDVRKGPVDVTYPWNAVVETFSIRWRNDD